jgi:chromosome segregation ATPase
MTTFSSPSRSRFPYGTESYSARIEKNQAERDALTAKVDSIESELFSSPHSSFSSRSRTTRFSDSAKTIEFEQTLRLQKTEIDHLARRLTETHEKLSNLREQNRLSKQEYENEIHELTDQLFSVTGRYTREVSARTTLERKATMVSEELEKWRAMVRAQSDQIGGLQGDVHELESENQKLRDEMSVLEVDKHRLELRQRLTEGKMQELEKRLNHERVSHESKRLDNSELLSELTRISRDCAKVKSSNRQLIGQISALTEQNSTLEESRETLVQQVESLESEVASLKSKMARLTRQNRGLRGESPSPAQEDTKGGKAEILAQLDQSQTELSQRREESRRLSEQLQEAEATKQTLGNELSRSRREQKTLRAENQAIKDEILAAKREFNAILGEGLDVDLPLGDFVSAIRERIQEKANGDQKVSNESQREPEQSDSREQEINALKAELLASTTEIANLRENEKKLRDQLEVARSESSLRPSGDEQADDAEDDTAFSQTVATLQKFIDNLEGVDALQVSDSPIEDWNAEVDDETGSNQAVPVAQVSEDSAGGDSFA